MQAPKERAKYDADPAKYFRKLPVLHSRTKAAYNVGVGYEAFTAPELFFSPEGHVVDWKKSLPEVRAPPRVGAPSVCRPAPSRVAHAVCGTRRGLLRRHARAGAVWWLQPACGIATA